MAALADLEKDKFNSSGEIKVSGSFGSGSGKTEYSASDITTLGSSTDMSDWLGAFNDGMLTYKYVQDWEGVNEKIVYLTHPSLGDGNKCLRLFKLYTTQGSSTVVQSVDASVVDWTFDTALQGTITMTLGAVTSPSVDAFSGTDVCSVSITNSGSGQNTLSLSGTNASLYTLNNKTQSQKGSTLTSVLATDTVVLETAANFTGSTYSHSLTVTLTETTSNQTQSSNVATSGTASGGSFVNLKYISDAYRGVVQNSVITGNYNRDSSSDKKGFFPDLDQASAFRSSSNVSYSFWFKRPKAGTFETSYSMIFGERYDNPGASGQSAFFVYIYSARILVYSQYNNARNFTSYTLPSDEDWHHFVVTTNSDDVVTGATGYIDGVAPIVYDSYTGATITRTGHSVNTIMFGGMTPAIDTASGTAISNPPTGNFVIDEFSTWKKQLTSSEVLSLYNSGSPFDLTTHSASADLQRWFRFGDTTGDGTAIKDSQETSVELTSFDSQDNTQNH